ncbi:MAG: hypothetical protein JO094_16055 [Hyphomicrobiales bacterium]|nr:hypothetical protein [Hyphomicrobiales bacterium]
MVGFLASENLDEFTSKKGVDGGAVPPDRVGVAHARRSVGIPHADAVEFEGSHLAMRAVGEHFRQRNTIESRFDRAYLWHAIGSSSCLHRPFSKFRNVEGHFGKAYSIKVAPIEASPLVESILATKIVARTAAFLAAPTRRSVEERQLRFRVHLRDAVPKRLTSA